MMDFKEGVVFAVNKPYGMSSFGALAHVRYLLSKRLGVKRLKIGHAGTLDPLATGVLIMCTGKMTKRIEEFQAHTKEYTATLRLGAVTPSYDMEHTVSQTWPATHVTRQIVVEVLREFEGDIQQVPPSYSAVKVDGKRAYSMRRKGQDVKLEPKAVRIDEIELTAFDKERQTIDIRVVCGKGTYIRALARDIGRRLGCGAFLTSLCRTRVGEITLARCVDFDHFAEWMEEVI